MTKGDVIIWITVDVNSLRVKYGYKSNAKIRRYERGNGCYSYAILTLNINILYWTKM